MFRFILFWFTLAVFTDEILVIALFVFVSFGLGAHYVGGILCCDLRPSTGRIITQGRITKSVLWVVQVEEVRRRIWKRHVLQLDYCVSRFQTSIACLSSLRIVSSLISLIMVSSSISHRLAVT